MKKQTIQEFETESYIDMIQNFMKANGGYITSKQTSELGIHRMYLKIMLDKGMIEKVSRGIYINKSTVEDAYYTLHLRYPKVIFSRFTALSFYGLTEVIPYIFELTTDYHYHVDDIDDKYHIIRCDKDNINLGLITIETSLGHPVYAYDRERCICDIIKYRNKLDLEQVKKSVRMYVKDKDKNIENLIKYSKILGIYNIVMDFVGMYYE